MRRDTRPAEHGGCPAGALVPVSPGLSRLPHEKCRSCGSQLTFTGECPLPGSCRISLTASPFGWRPLHTLGQSRCPACVDSVSVPEARAGSNGGVWLPVTM